AGGEQRPQALLRHVVLVPDRVAAEAEALEAPPQVESLAGRSDEEQPRAGPAPAQQRERLEELRDPLVDVQVAETADERLPAHLRRLRAHLGPRRVRDAVDRPREARRARTLLDVARVDDQRLRQVEDGAGERE